MSIYSWVFANAKTVSFNRLDYQTRGGCQELEPFVENEDSPLQQIAECLIAEKTRNYQLGLEPSWFAGYLDQQHYAVAVGGTQAQLLEREIPADGFRAQFCVFSYVFTDEDIHIYRRDHTMFQRLKEELWEIQNTGNEKIPENAQGSTSCKVNVDLSDYVVDCDSEAMQAYDHNVLAQSVETNHSLWLSSLRQAVLLSAASEDAVKAFLHIFPKGIASLVNGQESYSIDSHREKPLRELLRQNDEDVKKQEIAERERIKRIEADAEKEIEERRRKGKENPLPEHSGSDDWKDAVFGVGGAFLTAGITAAVGAKAFVVAGTGLIGGALSYGVSCLINEKSEHRK